MLKPTQKINPASKQDRPKGPSKDNLNSDPTLDTGHCSGVTPVLELSAQNKDVGCVDGITRRDFIRLSLAVAVAAGVGGHDMSRKAWAQSEFLPSPLETRVLGANSILSGSKASLRIITFDHSRNAPLRGTRVRVVMATPDGKEQTLFTGATNRRGTVDAHFDVPKLAKGNYELRVNATSPIGTDTLKAPITVTDSAQVMLTTDKPLYQPNQTIHIRALALARPDLKPVAEKPLTFEVEDSKGNKVFKKEVTTSRFGVASAEFVLGHEINMGRYTVRVVLGDVINERKVNVDKYVLPKFKVNVTTDKKYYLPGETLKGTVQVDYFFGKSVAGGEVSVRLATFDVGFHQFAEIKGKTDENGTYKFDTTLPASFVGLPLEQGNALVKLDVSVTDKAEHREKVTHTVPVAKDAIKITVLPESGALVPGLENGVYILTSYPDGAPAQCHFTLKGDGVDLAGNTDKLGIHEVRFTPKAGAGVQSPVPERPIRGRRGIAGGPAPIGLPADRFGRGTAPEGPPLQVTVTAEDAQGNKGATTTQIAQRVTDESLILRTDRAIAKVGEALNVELISTRQSGTAYVDLVKDKQTILTQSVDMSHGRGALHVNLDESLSGTIQAHAYIITPRGDIVRDTKIIYVNPANDLKISVKADKETYQPGAPAKLNLKVTDERGHPVLAALGVHIVDESVFALQEMQPGMEKIYFTLEKELLEPKVEVHGFTPTDIVPLVDEAPRLNPEKQKVARVLFAAAQPMVDFGIAWNSYQEKQQSVMQKWYERVARDATRFSKALEAYHKKHRKFPDPDEAINELLDEKLLTPNDLRDPLGTPYDIRPRFGAKDFNNGFLFISAGIDKKMNTEDDIHVAGYPGGYVGPVWGRMVRRLGKGGAKVEEFQEFDMVFDKMRMDAMEAPPGGVPGGIAGGVPGAIVQAQMVATKEVAREKDSARAEKSASAGEPVRVRQFFPETLFVNPNVLTDERGQATVSLNIADSITTWRLTTLASSMKGELGSTTSPLRVFQDFFVDIDLPVSLTQNDEVSIPVAVYNYLPEKQTVRLKLETAAATEKPSPGPDPWFELVNDPAEKSVEMDANQVGVVYYRIRVKGIGNHKLTVTARGTKLSDAIQRTIEVVPDGKEIWETVNDRLEGDVAKTMMIPAQAIVGGSNILVRIYPGAFSQVVDGLDKILRMPFG